MTDLTAQRIPLSVEALFVFSPIAHVGLNVGAKLTYTLFADGMIGGSYWVSGITAWHAAVAAGILLDW